MNRFVLVPTAACMSLAFATPATAQVVTLEQLRAQALKSRPELAMQAARVAGAEARVEAARAPQRPRVLGRVEATASPGSELITVNDADGDGAFVVAGSKALGDGIEAFEPQLRYSAQVGVDWNVWDFGRTDAATRAARAELRARQAETAQTRDSLVVAVDEVYLEWLGAHQRAELEADSVKRLTQRAQDLESRVQAGSLARSAVLPVKADLAAAKLQKSYADGAVRLARLAVEEAVGQTLGETAVPDPNLLRFGEASSQTASAAVDRTDEALAARADAARATVGVYDKRFMPQLRVSGSAGLRGQFGTVFPFYSAMLGLEIPISDGGQGAAQADAARADLRALTLQRQQRATEQRRRMTRLQLRLTQAQRRVSLAEALVAAAQARLTDAEERYDELAATPGEVGQARTQRGQAAAQLLTAKLDRARAALALDR